MRLIDADALKESLKVSFDGCTEWIKTAENDEIRHVAEGSRNAFLEAILRVKNQPTVDADALLKEQEPKQVNDIAQQISCFSGICPSCGKMLNTTCNKNFCGECGQAVKWE